MPIRVVHIGTGNVGRLALIQLITDPRFELVGLWVSTEAKVGTDAGELAGLDVTTGITATTDLDAVLATEPECAVYCAMGDTRPKEALDDCRRILERGINVVGSAPVTLQYPWKVLPERAVARVDQATETGNSSVFISGVDPGFANDLIPFALASTCQQIEQVRCMEIADYATYDGSTVMFDVMGFGTPADTVPLLLTPGVLTAAWGPAIHQMAAGLGIEVDEISESYTREPAPEDFEVDAGLIPRGGQAALQFAITGMMQGQPAVVIEHITRLRSDLRPDWPYPAQTGGSYRVEITGEPSYAVDICPSSRKGDHNHAAIVAAAGRIVNAIPAVLAAEPGICTTVDLPLVTGTGLYRNNQT